MYPHFSPLITQPVTGPSQDIFTLSYVTGRSVGIGAYLNRLGQRVIQSVDGPLVLTGYGALNKLLGKNVPWKKTHVLYIIAMLILAHFLIRDKVNGGPTASSTHFDIILCVSWETILFDNFLIAGLVLGSLYSKNDRPGVQTHWGWSSLQGVFFSRPAWRTPDHGSQRHHPPAGTKWSGRCWGNSEVALLCSQGYLVPAAVCSFFGPSWTIGGI